MESLNNKINTTQEDTLFQAQAVGVYGYNATDKKMKAGHMSDANELKVAVSQHLVDGPDMKARSDIADPATSTFIKCNPDGTLEMTAELDSSNLAKETTLGNVFGKVALTADRTFAIMNRQLGTSGEEVQHAKVMGSEDGATTGIQHQLAVDSAGHLQVDILSGGGSGDATAANQLLAQGKLDSIISNTGSLGDTANRTLLTAQNQTNGNQITNVKGNTAGDGTGTATSVLVDSDGHLQVDILSGGGSGDATAANQLLAQGKLDSIISNTGSLGDTANRTLLTTQNQTNGNQITNVKGNTAGDGTGTATSVLVDSDGHLQVDILSGGGSGDATAANQLLAQGTLSALNTKVTACDTGAIAGSVKVGNTVGDGTGTGTFLKTATDGSMHVVVENSDNVLIKGIQDGTSTQKDAKTNSNGDLRSALIGNTVKDGSGDNHYVLVDSDGKLETSGGGGGGGGQQYDGGQTLPSPIVGTAILGVDSGGLANVISTHTDGKIQNIIHGTNSSGVAYPVSINQFSRAIAVKNSISRGSQLDDTATIASGATYTSPYTTMANTRNMCVYGNTTNLTDKIHLYCKKTSYLTGDHYKLPSQYDITPDSSSGDFFIQLSNTSIPYLIWGKSNTTASSETILVRFAYTD